jgi:predicted SnoaL-like aldol condensation-catalyzing enzyme
MNKVLVLAAAAALSATADSAYAQSAAKGLSTNPAGIAAVEFLDLAINQRKIDDAVKYLAPPYTQHNLQIPDGIEGARTGIPAFTKLFPGLHLDFKRVMVDGDLVAVHSALAGMADHGSVVVDIFRVKDGKLVEHWDVIESVPAVVVNNNTMY